MPAIAAAPLFWGAIAGGGIAAGAQIYGAHKVSSSNDRAAQLQTGAANHAADLESQSARDALAFQQTQAERDQQNFEATQRANYDQWASREGRLSTLGSLVGLPARNIPAFQSTTHGPAADTSAAQASFQALTNGKPPTPDSLVSLEPQLQQQGIKVLRNAAGTAGKIQLPSGQIVDVIQAAGLGGKAWQWLTGDGGAPAPAATRPAYLTSANSLMPPPPPSLVRTAPLSSLPYSPLGRLQDLVSNG